jgi:hypothetical protein
VLVFPRNLNFAFARKLGARDPWTVPRCNQALRYLADVAREAGLRGHRLVGLAQIPALKAAVAGRCESVRVDPLDCANCAAAFSSDGSLEGPVARVEDGPAARCACREKWLLRMKFDTKVLKSRRI